MGVIHALYRVDGVTKYLTFHREILHMVDRQDFLTLYGIVVKHYESSTATGVGLMLWGDLKVLVDFSEGGDGASVWANQQFWQVRSWRLSIYSNVHTLEPMTGEVLYMFFDVSYPLSVELMERMLRHQLEIGKTAVGNYLTTAEQLVRFIKNQLVAAQVPAHVAAAD